jgi:pilus assembly protein Flp/PilA
MSFFSRFMKDESGATAIEYALIAAIVGLGLIAALGLLTNEIGNSFNRIGNTLKEKTGGT